jgi:hypothetical protein
VSLAEPVLALLTRLVRLVRLVLGLLVGLAGLVLGLLVRTVYLVLSLLLGLAGLLLARLLPRLPLALLKLARLAWLVLPGRGRGVRVDRLVRAEVKPPVVLEDVLQALAPTRVRPHGSMLPLLSDLPRLSGLPRLPGLAANRSLSTLRPGSRSRITEGVHAKAYRVILDVDRGRRLHRGERLALPFGINDLPGAINLW